MKLNTFIIYWLVPTIIIIIAGLVLTGLEPNKEKEYMTIYTNLSMYHVDIQNLTIEEESWDGQMKFDTYRALADSLEIMTANDVNISIALPQDCWVNSQTFLGDIILEVVDWEYDHRIIIGTVEYTNDMGWTYYPCN